MPFAAFYRPLARFGGRLTSDSSEAFTNITHCGGRLATLVPEHRRPSYLGSGVEADDNNDSEVERAQSRGTKCISYW
jgi:hypothetical protein